MKKKCRSVCALLLVGLLLSGILVGCGKEKEPEDPNHLVLGEYELQYKKAEIMTDSDGNDALVVTMDYTNASEKDASYLWTITDTAKQNGKELEIAVIFADEENFETITKDQTTEIGSNKTQEICLAYVLNDLTTPVDIIFKQVLGKEEASMTIETEKADRIESETKGTESVEEETESAVDEEEAQIWWNGDWFGWWMISNGEGGYEELNGNWWDCCAVIDLNGSGDGSIELWDENVERSEGLAYAIVSLEKGDDTGEYGILYCENGFFLDSKLLSADWIIDPDDMDLAHMIKIEGWYEDEDGSFTYDFYLRPWGILWDDVEESDRPYVYDSWYLPLVEAGEHMPDDLCDANVSKDNDYEPDPDDYENETSDESVSRCYEMQTYFETCPTMVEFETPEQNWYVEDTYDYQIEIIQAGSREDRNWDTPYMLVELEESLEDINFYLEEYENVQEVDSRIIDGVEMQARTFEFGGNEWVEYYGEVSTGAWVRIRLSNLEAEDGSECAEILESMKFW